MFNGQISYKFLLLVLRKDLKELEEGLENVKKKNGGKLEITLKKLSYLLYKFFCPECVLFLSSGDLSFCSFFKTQIKYNIMVSLLILSFGYTFITHLQHYFVNVCFQVCFLALCEFLKFKYYVY